MNEDQLRQLLIAEANKIVPAPRAQERAEQRAAQLRRRRAKTLTGGGALAAAAAVLVAVMISINGQASTRKVSVGGPGSTDLPNVLNTPATSEPGPSVSTAGGPATTTTKPVRSRCHTSQLAVTTGPVGAAAGTISASFILTNTSRVTCTLFGYPGFELLDSQHQPMLGTVSRTGSIAFPAMKPQHLSLPPGRQASFSVGYSDIPPGNQPCPTSITALITPPDETTQLTIADQAPVCGQPFYVSPVVAGTNGASR